MSLPHPTPTHISIQTPPDKKGLAEKLTGRFPTPLLSSFFIFFQKD
jgi:hypothetical protein